MVVDLGRWLHRGFGFAPSPVIGSHKSCPEKARISAHCTRTAYLYSAEYIFYELMVFFWDAAATSIRDVPRFPSLIFHSLFLWSCFLLPDHSGHIQPENSWFITFCFI